MSDTDGVIEPDFRLLTATEASALLGVPERTLAHWRTERTGPLALRIGVHVRYRLSDLEAWVEELAAEARRRWAS